MSIHLAPEQSLVQRLRGLPAEKFLAGMWVSTASEVVAEIAAASGLHWVLFDGEHSPLTVAELPGLLRAVYGHPASAVVRVPANDPVVIKQFLDAGAQNVIVPMVDTVDQARAAAAAVEYPPKGVRGVGSALARASMFGAIPDYLATARSRISLIVQIESARGVENAAEIAAVDGVDAVFIGPSDLAASLGLLGQQTHPDVVALVNSTIETVTRAGKSAGVNAFDPDQARKYLDNGAQFVLVGADVGLLSQGARAWARTWARD